MRAPLRAAHLLPLLALAACASSVGPSDGAVVAPDAPVTPDAGAPAACTASSDCGWGEIDHEILSRADCPCLFGCPTIPQNRATIARRQAQYSALCTPGVDGAGHACAVDDCAIPPTAVCRAGVCQGP